MKAAFSTTTVLNRREFTERFGDPANFIFRAQYYHSTTPMKCALCGRDIRNVYTLRTQGRSVPSGECCFSLFEEWNPEVYARLMACKFLLNAYEQDTQADIKTYNAVGDVRYRRTEWNRLRRKVHQTIRDYRKATGSGWLPRPLYDVLQESNRKPGKSMRWFESHIPTLKELIRNSSAASIC